MPRLSKLFMRRTAMVLAAVLILAAAGAIAANYFLLNAAYLGPLINTIVERRAGLNLTVGHLSVQWFPPRVVATDVTVSRPDASVFADRVAFDVDLSRIVSREIVVKAGEIDGLTAHLPEDVGRVPGIVRDVREQILATSGGRLFVNVEIESVAAAARVYLGYSGSSAVAGNVQLANILSDRIGLIVDASLDEWGDAARLYGSVEFLRAEPGAPWQTDGEAWVDAIQTEKLPIKNMPEAEFGGRFVFYPTDAGPGVGFAARLESATRPEITGEISAAAVWDGEHARISQCEWVSQNANASASGDFTSVDDWHFTMTEANATEGPLDAMLALLERPRARFEAESGATIAVRRLDVSSEDGSLRVAGGELQFDGISIVPIENPGGEAVMEAGRGLRGSVSSEGGIILVKNIQGQGLRISGRVKPDTNNRSFFLDLTGDMDLSQFPLAALNDSGAIEQLRGRASVTHFQGTFASGGGVPDDLAIEGTLRDGSLRYRTNNAVIGLDQVDGEFKTGGDGILTVASARGAGQSEIALNGSYDVRARRWTGVLDADMEPFVTSTFEEMNHLEQLARAARIAGASRFHVEMQLPVNGAGMQLDVARESDGGPTVNARLEFDGGLRRARISATVSGDRLMAEFFPRLDASGDAHAEFNYDADSHAYAVQVDATKISIDSNTILHKAEGTELTLHADGRAGDSWTLNAAEIMVDGRTLLRRGADLAGGRFEFEINLDSLPPLLTDGATATGTIRGTINPDPLEGEFQLVKATLALNPVLTFDHIDGAISFSPNLFSCENLVIRGARSDCTFSLVRRDGRWSGGAQGPQLDVEALTEVIDAVRLLDPRVLEEGSPRRSLWESPTLGEFTIDLGHVYYRRGKMDTVRLRILGEERAIRFTEFSAKPGGGDLLGSCVILPGETTDAILKLAAKWNEVDGRVVNDVLLPEDRGFFGNFSGELTFDAPVGALREVLASGTGAATLAGTKGSLGKIGFASALLTALKTTEIINLRAPTLRDRGLVFDTLKGSLKMTDGVMTVDGFSLDGGAYTMTAKGVVDFAQDKTDVDAFVRVFESVGRLVKKIPLVGDLATALSTDLIGVPVHFSGSPYKVQAGVMAATGKSVLTAPVRAGEGALKAVGDTLKKLTPGGNNDDENK